ncbi:MAG: H-NS histone family protein [Thiomicrospira sp.]|jgi:DNA-binding protein H-NS|nr:H-NS histone family protein [Thiomicrospira sp.]
MIHDSIRQLSVQDLIDLREFIDNEIEAKQKEEKKALMNQFKALAAQSGLTLEEVLGMDANKKRKGSENKVAPKYRDPHDASLVWTGRGRAPAWMQAHLDRGGNKDDLLIRD